MQKSAYSRLNNVELLNQSTLNMLPKCFTLYTYNIIWWYMTHTMRYDVYLYTYYLTN